MSFNSYSVIFVELPTVSIYDQSSSIVIHADAHNCMTIHDVLNAIMLICEVVLKRMTKSWGSKVVIEGMSRHI